MTEHMSLEQFKAERAEAERKMKAKAAGQRTTSRKTPIDYEGQAQTEIFNWLAGEEQRGGMFGPLNQDVYHVPNGGARNKVVAAKLKAQGARAGIVDIFCDRANGGYFGLRIELKAERPHNAPLSDTQLARMKLMQERGYYVALCLGAEEAISVLKEYAQWPRTVVGSKIPLKLGHDWENYPVSKKRVKGAPKKKTVRPKVAPSS